MPAIKRRDLAAEGQRILRATLAAADRRLLDAVKATRAATVEYRVAHRESERLYHEAECHPDMPEIYERRAFGKPRTPMSNEAFKAANLARVKVWRTVGYDFAHRKREEAWKRLRPLLRRVCALRPQSVGALSAKAATLKTALDVDFWDDEDFVECGLPVLLADLERLAKGGAA
jgi:hypothetical protein